MPQLPPQILFGAAYYHEYSPTDRLQEDLDLMAEANFNVIRVGESVWSTWEPEDGRFDLEWLQPVLDGAHERGISVVLGTPTYAVPPWLARRYPEITGERRTGERIGWGARQEVDFTHPGFLFHAERVIRAMMERYADHPSIIGFQVDNEPGLQIFHNHGVFQRFVDHLRHEYGDVETLNREWGLVYWSHRISTWADLWTPDGNEQPQYDVAWRRFQGLLTDEFIGWQADLVREYASDDHFVTTCISYERPAVDDEKVSRRLDIASGNPYYGMQDELALPEERDLVQGWKSYGTWALFESADRMYASLQDQYLVTETNASHIGQCWDNRPAFDGQWRQSAWALISRGARMVEYWQWYSLLFGAETYWGGVLPHSGKPGRTYAELSRLGAELKQVGGAMDGMVPDADVTFLYSTPTKWLMQKHPALMHADGTPDENAYRGFFDPFYRAAFDAGLQSRLVHARQLVDTDEGPGMAVEDAVKLHPVLVVPAFYVAEDASLAWLDRYARAGGHLVLGPRTGYADHEARARQAVAPDKLHEAAGVHYDEFSNIAAEIATVAAGGGRLTLEPDAAATRWIDGLQVDGAETLAEYSHPHFGRWPAVTTHAVEKGRVTYVGTVPNPSLGRSVFRHLVPEPVSGWTDQPDSVTVTSARLKDGRRLHVVHNWSWNPVEAKVPTVLTPLVGGEPLHPGDSLRLDSWDVHVLVEHG